MMIGCDSRVCAEIKVDVQQLTPVMNAMLNGLSGQGQTEEALELWARHKNHISSGL